MQQQANMNSITQVNQNMNDFQSAMDKLTITGNMMNAQMDMGMFDPSSDTNVRIFWKISSLLSLLIG